MKSCFKYMAGALAAMAFIQCASVQEVEPSHRAKGSFEVYASPGDTRTANDGLHTLWVDGDRFNLFHAAAGSTAYVSDGAFSIDDPDTGHARGTVTGLSEGTYDWLLVYPYTQEASAPTAVPVVIGSAAGGKQAQSGKDSRVHLAGETFPVAGKAAGIPSVDVPVLTAAPLLSVIAVNVTNPGQGSVKVETVRFKAPEAVVGSFTVDVTGSAPVFRAVDASDEAVLEISGKNRIAAGESAVFFLGIKPFQAAAGSTLTLTVNDQPRTLTLPKATAFAAGKIKTLNITLPESEPDSPYYFKRVTTVTSGRKYLFVAKDSKLGGLRMACPLPEGTTAGRMDAVAVTEEDGIIALDNADYVFTVFDSEKGYLVRQPDGRYLTNKNQDNVNVSEELSAGSYWTVTFDADGLASFVNGTRSFQYNPTTSVQKFQIRQTSSSVGLHPWIYELQNDDEAVETLLAKTVPGVYDYAGQSWTYADGQWQTSVRTLDGTVAFRLFHPSDYTVVQVTGIPAAPAQGNRFKVRLVRYVKQIATHAEDVSVSVLKAEAGQAWLMGDNGTGFIVKYQ